ncbi:multi-sensor signal transduction histidine kinase [Richelia sinica FACHB-800]|uniref:histidine kinase n=1 Tax=Richelia sinica FACHB-800 TaxID=1357546 RepID=A0A975T659_9NOST|nr:ATP-binding protein [Richelia sinica]MBD2666339.1 response regulator [Richelia sinica FACHB-800]QXE22956.1 multi-sensor signal transduction histidine kinase [Richelia sinica FACHB-800]
MSNHQISSPKADILVIDDTPENLNLLAAMLKTQGYKVRSVTKGSTGLRGALAAPPDLILLDVNMPEMNGYEVCQQLKNYDQTREIPVIFISALGDVLDKVKAFAMGGVDYITKPFQVEEVLARIENHLTIRRLQQQLQNQNLLLQQEIYERSKAEEKFTKVFRSSPNPIIIITLQEGRIIDINPSFLKMSGYRLEDLIGHQALELNWGKDSQTIAHAISSLPEVGSIYNQEFEFLTKYGDIKIILLSIELIELSGLVCGLLIANDITERKRLENEFISLVSHELRTPLTSIMGAMDLLETQQLGTLTEQGKKVMKIASSNTERLIRLVNDILDLERMKAGKIVMRKVKYNAADLMINATDAMQAMADQLQIKLVVHPLPVTLWCDPDRLLQTLINLLNNAIKFSQPGDQIWLSATLTAQPDETLSHTSSQSLLLTIQDQGRGIPEDKLQTIFEPFQQVDASDSRQKGGTGLGLAICRNIVQQHQGKIWVQSKLGEGSIFYVLLPLIK